MKNTQMDNICKEKEINKNPEGQGLSLGKICNSPLKSPVGSKMSSTTPPGYSKNSAKGLLNKKRTRKNSDLNLANPSSSKKSEKNYSPYTTDTKITSYFLQKKSSSFKKCSGSDLSPFKLGKTAAAKGCFFSSDFSTDSKLPFAKRLDFDNCQTNQLTPSDLKNYNFGLNIQFTSEFKYESNSFDTSNFLKKFNLQGGSNESKCEKKQYFRDEYENLKPCLFDSINCKPTLSQKTMDIVMKVRRKRKRSENLNLNLQKIIKQINNSSSKGVGRLSSDSGQLVKNIEKLLSNNSMREKYEELLKRELMLPCHYKNLLLKFTKLDNILNIMKRTNKVGSLTLTDINLNMNESYKLTLSQEDFQRMLFITPHFFIYKWEKKKLSSHDYELSIDIPNDICSRITEKYSDQTNFTKLQTFPFIPLNQPMTEETLSTRKNLFKKVLLHLINEQHRKFLKEKGIITKLNPFKHRTWHSEFEVHKISQIELFKLIEKPKL